MASVRWYQVSISFGSWQREIFLYETDAGLFDLQYHWMYTSDMAGDMNSVLQDFQQEFARHHKLTERGLQLAVGTPVEVSWTDVQAARPRNMPKGYFDPP